MYPARTTLTFRGRALVGVLRVVQGITIALAFTSGATAATLRIASQGDALSMDPHSLAETVQFSVTNNVYEGLTERDASFKIAPALATGWKQVNPTTWRFELRKNVVWHDRTPFTADDVIFSWQRARAEGSDVKIFIAPIKEVVKVNDYTVDMVTDGPYPILPELITNWYIMSRAWCVANQATRPVDRRKGIENVASFKANGTGPLMVRERVPGVRTVFRRNAVYWRKLDSNVDEVVFNVIGNDATRVAALLSGEVDVIDPVPPQDLSRVSSSKALRVVQGPENRVIFLGMDQKREELLYSSVKGRNPFKDRRVRQAFYQAIDMESIRTNVMRGGSNNMALIVPPEVNGYATDLSKRLPYNPEAARKLLSEAGYPSGFELTLNCPNDRYVNDVGTCQAVTANLARVGIKVKLEAESKALWFPRILRRDTSFYLLGWSASTIDAHNALFAVAATPGTDGRGSFNLGSYSNPKVDELIDRIATTVDMGARNDSIREALRIHQEDIGHIPLHQPFLYWGVRRNVSVVQLPSARMPWQYIYVAEDKTLASVAAKK